MTGPGPLNDRDLDRLLARDTIPAVPAGLADRIIAEAQRTDRVSSLAPPVAPRIARRRPWSRRTMIAGIIAINLFAASAIAAVFGGHEGLRRLSTLSAQVIHSIATVIPHRHHHAPAPVSHTVVSPHRMVAAEPQPAAIAPPAPERVRIATPAMPLRMTVPPRAIKPAPVTRAMRLAAVRKPSERHVGQVRRPIPPHLRQHPRDLPHQQRDHPRQPRVGRHDPTFPARALNDRRNSGAAASSPAKPDGLAPERGPASERGLENTERRGADATPREERPAFDRWQARQQQDGGQGFANRRGRFGQRGWQQQRRQGAWPQPRRGGGSFRQRRWRR